MTYQDKQKAELAIYRAAYEEEQAGFNAVSRHANCLLKMVAWADGGYFAQERAAYIAGRLISGEYRK